jgi:GAF domain-containing protein
MDDAKERARLAALHRLEILDTAPDAVLDDIAEVAALALDCPIAVISLVDKERIWLKSHPGLAGVDELARDPGLCGTAVQQDDPWVVENAAVDPRTLANPLVAGDFGLRFYAGVPLRGADGHNLGMLAAIDAAPRAVSERELAILKKLAATVTHVIEARYATRLLSARAVTSAG